VKRLVPVAVGVALATCGPEACGRAPRRVVLDLAQRVGVAERWSGHEMILCGSPAAEPHLASGFFREAKVDPGSPFVWAGAEAELSFTWPAPASRQALLDMAPYQGVSGQSAEVSLNGTRIATLRLNDTRYRYALALPVPAQRAGENRLRFAFASTSSPSARDAQNPDTRQLAAAFYSLTLGAGSDAALEDLLGRDAPRPFSVTTLEGVPRLDMAGPSAVRYAFEVPSGAELRFTPGLDPAARAAASNVAFRVTVESEGQPERELWSATIGVQDPPPREVVVDLGAEAGRIVRLGLHAGGGVAGRFAWGSLKAPRLLARETLPAFERPLFSAAEAARGDGLRQALAGRNVVLIILDAARAQSFGAYGYERATTPAIDRMAREGIVFDRAFTPAVYTLGAMSSVWTSQPPDRHHSAVAFSARLPKNRLTLAELLGAGGVPTAGFVANAVAGTAFGFERGFGDFEEIFKDLGSAASGFAKVVPPWLDAHGDKPFFLYLHYREPHFPYDPPPPFDTRFGPDQPIPKAQRQESDWIEDLNQSRRAPADGEIAHLRRLYDGNLAFADQEIGRLRTALEERGLWERSVVIVAADHGEGLFEHAWIGHNVQLYEPSMHIPLIVRLPSGSGPAGTRVSGLVDLTDLAPTIAEIFGVMGKGSSAREFEGRSLLPVVGGAPGRPAVLSRTVWDRPRYALRDARYKFVYDTRTGAEELYDLETDPGETRNVAQQAQVRSAYYRQALHHWTFVLARRGVVAGGEASRPTPEQCENLKALGYVNPDCEALPVR
jgi:arylsulfatase A-like enzyme